MSWMYEQISLLIDLYKNYQCLYIVKHKDCHNKYLRNLALQQIGEGLKNLRPMTTEADIQKKIRDFEQHMQVKGEKYWNPCVVE